MGEKCCAYIVPMPGQELTFEEIISFLKEKKFAPYKLPERVEFIDKLPKAGEQLKVVRRLLEQDIAEKLKAEGKLR
jgi:non-ribosomal peptide synthetase component E (peptide arylation enzyme)